MSDSRAELIQTIQKFDLDPLMKASATLALRLATDAQIAQIKKAWDDAQGGDTTQIEQIARQVGIPQIKIDELKKRFHAQPTNPVEP